MVKDMDIFMDREQKDIIMVDKSILSFAFHLSNGIPIEIHDPNNEEDNEILYLVVFFDELFF